MVRKVARGSMTVRWRAKDGNNGDDAVTYDIVPSEGSIHALANGTVVSDGIIVRAYRTEGAVRSVNILPEEDYPDEGEYYFAEYRVDGGLWLQCGQFYYPTGPADDIEWLPYYGIDDDIVKTATRGIAFRLKHSSAPTVVLKEIPPIKVVKDGADEVDVICGVKQMTVSCDSSGKAKATSVSTSFALMAKDGTTANCSGVSVVSSPSGVTTHTHSDTAAIPVHGFSCSVAVNTDRANFEGNIILQVTGTVKGLTYTKRYILPIVAQLQGVQGIDGCIRRIREWKVGDEYRNDKELVTDGLRYIDIAVKKSNGSVTLACICLKTHTATAALEPQDSAYTTVDGVRYWEKQNNLGPIYTPFIWADDAIFQFTQTNQLVVLKANNGGVNVALGGGTWPLWIGAVLAGLSGTTPLAPFQVKDNGEFWATNAHIKGEVEATSGKFTGEVQATSGKFEGTVKAQLFYGKTIVVTSNSYTINPETAPGSTFYYENPTANTWIYLPSPTTYDGMEINIYIRQDDESKLSLRHHVSPNGNTLCYKMNIYNIVITTSPYKTAAVENYNKPVLTTTGGLRIIPGCFYTFKAMNNCWHAIKGMFTGE